MNLEGRFFRFLIAGGIAATTNVLARILFGTMVSYVPAIALAYCVGMIVAFLLNRSFVFESRGGPLAKQISWFVAVNLFALLQTVLVSLLLARVLFPSAGGAWLSETIAHAIGVIVPVFTSYFGHTRLTFKPAE